VSYTLERHSFSELLASAGELLHTPMRVSTFMTTDLLSSASSILKRGSLSEHLDIPGTFSEHPASPVLLTSEGPQKAQATLCSTQLGEPSERGRRPSVCTGEVRSEVGSPLAAIPGLRLSCSVTSERHLCGKAITEEGAGKAPPPTLAV